MTSSVFARALAAKDSVAMMLVDRAVETLGLAIASAATILDIPLVVIGGGLADRLGTGFVERISAAALAQMPSGQADVLRVIPGQLRDRGGALGAALVCELEGAAPLAEGHAPVVRRAQG
jgi:glucokinase